MIDPETGARIVRAWKRGGAPVLVVVSSCLTERGARRVARKYPGAEIHPSDDGRRFEVWAAHRD